MQRKAHSQLCLAPDFRSPAVRRRTGVSALHHSIFGAGVPVPTSGELAGGPDLGRVARALATNNSGFWVLASRKVSVSFA
jgi:hypothetical protein